MIGRMGVIAAAEWRVLFREYKTSSCDLEWHAKPNLPNSWLDSSGFIEEGRGRIFGTTPKLSEIA